MSSRYGIVGNESSLPEFDLPQTAMPEQDLREERAAAKFSKMKEYKLLKEHLEQRIAYYQGFLPSGDPVVTKNPDFAQLGQGWMVANAVIAEFKAVIGAYEAAADAVKEADGRNGAV